MLMLPQGKPPPPQKHPPKTQKNNHGAKRAQVRRYAKRAYPYTPASRVQTTGAMAPDARVRCTGRARYARPGQDAMRAYSRSQRGHVQPPTRAPPEASAAARRLGPPPQLGVWPVAFAPGQPCSRWSSGLIRAGWPCGRLRAPPRGLSRAPLACARSPRARNQSAMENGVSVAGPLIPKP